MKYNIGDVVKINMKHIYTNRVAIVLEQCQSTVCDNQTGYNYRVLICGVENPRWIRGDEIVEKIS